MFMLQCGTCGKLRDMADEQVIELSKTPRDIPRCPEDNNIMWPIGADNPSDRAKKVCIDTANSFRPENLN